jgi:hypothetical protein
MAALEETLSFARSALTDSNARVVFMRLKRGRNAIGARLRRELFGLPGHL